MTIFAVLMPIPQINLIGEIERLFSGNYLKLNETNFLISASGTASELSAKLGIYDAKEPNKVSTGNAVILVTSSYFGRAPANVWEWMKAKLETPPNG